MKSKFKKKQVTFAPEDEFRHRAGLAAGGAPVFRWWIGERWMTSLATKTKLLPSLVTRFLISLMAKIELSRPA